MKPKFIQNLLEAANLLDMKDTLILAICNFARFAYLVLL